MKKILLISLMLVQSYGLLSQSIKDSLTHELTQIVKASGIPGMGVCSIGEQGILYTQGFGYRDKETKTTYDSLTIQPVASISKPFIGMAIMQLVEAGKLNLDDDINKILPFKVSNPAFPNVNITLRHLATHTSSILETDFVNLDSYIIEERNAPKEIFPKGDYKYYKKYLKNVPLALDAFIQSYLSEGGKHFRPKIFGNYAPGEQYLYTNIGACLAAYIVELASGQSFSEYTQQNIFDPLGMKSAAWKKKDISSANIAQLYFQNGQAVPEYRLITYPAAELHINSRDMGIYMAEIIQGYYGKGTLLNNEHYQLLLSNQINSENIQKKKGIFWDINFEDNIGHDGGEIGVACNVIFSPRLRKAFFVMVNCSLYDDKKLEKGYVQVLMTLSKYVRRLDG